MWPDEAGEVFKEFEEQLDDEKHCRLCQSSDFTEAYQGAMGDCKQADYLTGFVF